MKLRDLAKVINAHIGYLRDYEDPDVTILVSKPSIGSRAMVDVEGTSMGFDWEKGKFILNPKERLVPKTDKEDVYDMSWELLMYIATKPLKKPTYEVEQARKMFEAIGYDYMKYQKIYHRD